MRNTKVINITVNKEILKRFERTVFFKGPGNDNRSQAFTAAARTIIANEKADKLARKAKAEAEKAVGMVEPSPHQ